MKGAVVFYKFDLKSAYNLVRIREGDEYKTAFNTKFGLFEHLVMPFCLTNGVEIDPDKINVVTELPQPENVKQMQSFLGFCNYYRKFIGNFSEISKPLFKMTSKKEKFEWTEEGLVVFYKLKEMLTSPPVLAYPDNEKQFFVECDASNYAIGGVLSQKGDDGSFHSI